MSAPTSYSRTQIALHWIIAALVSFQILFHEGIEHAWRDRMRGVVPNVATPNLHAIIGVLILVLVIWRLWIRFDRGTPALPEDEHPALKLLAQGTHGLLYALLILMPVSGAIAWLIGISEPAIAHSLMEKLIILLVGLHVLGALVQHFWFRTDVLKRMLGMA